MFLVIDVTSNPLHRTARSAAYDQTPSRIPGGANMAFAEIPTQEEFKRACGRTAPSALFKKKNDLNSIFTALHLAEPHRSSGVPQAIPFLRKVRKECCDWIGRNESVVRVSAPKVKDLCDVVHRTIDKIVEQTYGGRRLALPQKPTFKQVVQRAMEVRGTTPQPVGKTLDESYWLEKILPKHLGKGAWSAALNQWKGKGSKTRLNFPDWLEHIYVPECEDDPYGKYIANRNQDLAQKITAGKGVKYCDAQERRSYVVKLAAGKLLDAQEQTYDTTNASTVFSGPEWAIFVWAPDDTIYANSHTADEFHHSSFLAGGPIKCGGEFQVKTGNITKVTPKTGHYKAGIQELTAFLEFCQRNGVDLSHVDVCPKPIEEPNVWVKGD